MKKILPLLLLAMTVACSENDHNDIEPQTPKGLTITSSIDNFVGDEGSRTNVEGTQFADGDLMRLKIVCPYTPDAQNGESTYGNTYDAFWLLKWNGTQWTRVTSQDHFDITGSYGYSNAQDIFSVFEAQATPYVYTASTWSEEKLIRTQAGELVGQYSHVFHHDQSQKKNYLASDLLWAQQYSQTGAQNIHLNFRHAMACLRITINDAALAEKISDNAVLTISGMPAIDQQEVVIGDYYAHKSKVNSNSGRYSYKQKAACSYEQNGSVLGISIIDEQQQKAIVKPFLTVNTIGQDVVNNDGIYTCYRSGAKEFRVIIPPFYPIDAPRLTLRDGARRYSMPVTFSLGQSDFAQGHLYNVTMTLQ